MIKYAQGWLASGKVYTWDLLSVPRSSDLLELARRHILLSVGTAVGTLYTSICHSKSALSALFPIWSTFPGFPSPQPLTLLPPLPDFLSPAGPAFFFLGLRLLSISLLVHCLVPVFLYRCSQQCLCGEVLTLLLLLLRLLSTSVQTVRILLLLLLLGLLHLSVSL